MSEDSFELKPIQSTSVGRALEKARQYRLLNVPVQAESICLDILAVEPTHQAAIHELVLALTDQFTDHSGGSSRVRDAKQWVAKLEDEYQRAYSTGLIHEREGHAYLGRGMASSFAYDSLRDAMDCYEKAERLRPADNEDAVLRWNACVRTIRRERLQPRHDGPLPLLE